MPSHPERVRRNYETDGVEIMGPCAHNWVMYGVTMPEGYWKPTGPEECLYCGVLKMSTATISTNALYGTHERSASHD